jgi:hypothetical protein
MHVPFLRPPLYEDACLFATVSGERLCFFLAQELHLLQPAQHGAPHSIQLFNFFGMAELYYFGATLSSPSNSRHLMTFTFQGCLQSRRHREQSGANFLNHHFSHRLLSPSTNHGASGTSAHSRSCPFPSGESCVESLVSDLSGPVRLTGHILPPFPEKPGKLP